MTKEELIGRKFQHKITNDIYQIFKGKGDKIDLKELVNGIPTSEEFIGMYTLAEALAYTSTGSDWILLPIENKMYKTPKGIEYGVGTVFTHQGRSNTIVEIVAEGDEYPIKFLYNNDEKSYMSFNWFCENIDKGNWKIITNKPTMKDYKQVDPKTIKFDFTSTKIKVNTDEEAAWVIEAAVANGSRRPNDSTSTHRFFYIWADKDICWACGLNEDCGRTYKEITIQDILNNMKEVIEVGDVVTYIEQAKYGYDTKVVERLGSSAGQPAIYYVGGGFDYTKDLKLVSKAKKKEIIGYETVVDLPGIPKRSKFNYPTFKANQDGKYYLEGNVTSKYYELAELSDTKFFKPIYKQDTLEIKFSKYTATLSKEHGLVFTDGEKMPFTVLLQLVKDAQVSFKLGKYAGFEVTGEVELKSIKVGCKSFTAADVKLVSDSIKKLD